MRKSSNPPRDRTPAAPTLSLPSEWVLLLADARRFNDLLAGFLGTQTKLQPAPATNATAWSPTLDCGKVNHAAAFKAVAKLNEQSFQGHTDWRLPEIRELLSLVDYTRVDPAIDVKAFPDTKSAWYWTASSCAGDPDYAWIVHFHHGFAYWNSRSHDGFVRAVRGPGARASQ